MGAVTEYDIRKTVRDCLLMVKKDEAFMDHDLDAKDFDVITLGKDEAKTYRFFELVSSTLNVTGKRKVKKFITSRLEGKKFVKDEIATFDPNIQSTLNDTMPNISSGSIDFDQDNGSNKKRRRSSNSRKDQPSSKIEAVFE